MTARSTPPRPAWRWPSAISRALCAGLLLLGCESTAFNLDEGGEENLVLSPAFMEGAVLTAEIEATVQGVEDPDNGEGDPRTWSVEAAELSPTLTLESWSFESNFRLILRLTRAEGAASGAHEIVLRIHNHFGTFIARGDLFIFP